MCGALHTLSRLRLDGQEAPSVGVAEVCLAHLQASFPGSQAPFLQQTPPFPAGRVARLLTPILHMRPIALLIPTPDFKLAFSHEVPRHLSLATTFPAIARALHVSFLPLGLSLPGVCNGLREMNAGL